MILGNQHLIGRIRPAGAERRGSVYLLVVSILSVLVLLTLTLSYVSRMDLLASRNWAEAVQGRMAAVAGGPNFAAPEPVRDDEAGKPSLTMNQGGQGASLNTAAPAGRPAGMSNLDAALQAVQERNRRQALQPFKLGLRLDLEPAESDSYYNADGTARRSRGAMAADPRAAMNASRSGRPSGNASSALAMSAVEDESAKININAVLPDLENRSSQLAAKPLTQQGRQLAEAAGAVTEADLARLIDQVAAVARLPKIDSRSLAHAIALRRYGPDGRPGRAFTDDNANNGYTDALHDTIDNDRDGLIDEPDEALVAATHDGLDNNRNGTIDETGESIAQDGLDNNRTGRADEPNEAIDDPDEATADPRLPVMGDDTPYAGLEELMAVPGMTPALYRALAPHLTVFSVSYAAFALDQQDQAQIDGLPTEFPQVDPNTARPEQIYQVLKRRFPKANSALLGQFTVNLIDRRDLDNLPTALQVGTATYYGMEINPCLNEVCPDPNFGENKDGQFVELFNPWSQPINLSGWSLQGMGVQAPLSGTLPPGGYLVLTDDINNDNDATPEDDVSEGSFYNVFHRVASGPQHQLVELPGLKLPPRGGKIQLVNSDQAVVDEFRYGDGRNKGAAKSFQRLDPRLREAKLKAATPLDENKGLNEVTGGEGQIKLALKMMEQWQNQPLRSPLDVMLVATAYGSAATTGSLNSSLNSEELSSDTSSDSSSDLAALGDTTQGLGDPLAAHAFQLPLLNTSEAGNLDARLVDCFRVGAVIPDSGAGFPGLDDSQGAPDEAIRRMARRMSAGDASMRMNQYSGAMNVSSGGMIDRGNGLAEPRCMKTFGRVNLNTAPAAVILALPGMTTAMARRIVLARGGLAARAAEQNASGATGVDDRTWWTPENPLRPGRWANLSDFIRDETVWESTPLYDRLDAVYAYSQMAAFNTLALRVVTASLPSEPEAPAAGANPAGRPSRGSANAAEVRKTASGTARRQSTIRAERIITVDRGRIETVTFGFLGAPAGQQPDPDALQASKTAARGNAGRLNLNAIAQQVAATNQRLAAEGHAAVMTVPQRGTMIPRATRATLPVRVNR